ncbi:MAG: ATP-grasp domain protein [Candidatus Moranbacteria bacterium GW2011_GWE2_47_10]|nr:MAG: ATP-grasp domain protein [Candidatus Moranbacteria bacterium GW2011_GWE2_47_10]
MKKALILFGSSDWKKKDILSDEKYREAYEYLYTFAESRGLDLYRASYDWYDAKKKLFKYAWTFKDGKWKRVKRLKPDIVYDKAKSSVDAYYIKSLIRMDYTLVNHPEFTHFVNNKYLASLIFPDHFKKYYRVDSSEDLLRVRDEISSDKVVLKPIKGSGGKGVEILNDREMDDFEVNNTLIAQEFVDSSSGIEDIVSGVHDLRLVFVNDDLVYSYVREPAAGSLLANVSKGGTMKIVEKHELPPSVFGIIEDVQEKFSFYHPKVYTIDLIFDENQKPWIIEFNTMPGIYFSPGQEKWRDRMYESLINMLKNEA